MTEKKILLVSMAVLLCALMSCKFQRLTDVEKQMRDAEDIDNSAAKYAQLLFGDLNDVREIRVTAVNERSNFVTSKASVNAILKTVYARYGFEVGSPGGEFGDSANALVLLKTRTPEAIKYITGVSIKI